MNDSGRVFVDILFPLSHGERESAALNPNRSFLTGFGNWSGMREIGIGSVRVSTALDTNRWWCRLNARALALRGGFGVVIVRPVCSEAHRESRIGSRMGGWIPVPPKRRGRALFTKAYCLIADRKPEGPPRIKSRDGRTLAHKDPSGRQVPQSVEKPFYAEDWRHRCRSTAQRACRLIAAAR